MTSPPKTKTGLLFDRLLFKKEMKPLQGIGMTTKRVLLIHKNPTVGVVMQACLTDLVGWKVGVASSTGEGLRQASLYQPDAIILEVSIGEIDGFLFLKQLKTQPETQGVPVMLLTLKAKWLDLPQSWLHKSQLAAAIVNPLEPTMLAVEIAKVLGWDLH
jgi:CheY-like chemotaxis protein